MTTEWKEGWKVWAYRDYRRFIASRLLYTLNSQMINLSVAWLVYERTRDPLSLGLIGLFAFLPNLALSLVTGAIADRFDRWVILVCCYAFMVASVSLFLLTLDAQSVLPAYLLVSSQAVTRAFSAPASQSLMPNLVPNADFPSAAGWSNTFNQTATIVGPSFAGLLYPLGVRTPFVVAGGCALLALLLHLRVSRPKAPAERRPRVTFETLVAGYRFIWMSRAIMGAITLDLVAVLLGGATVLLPVYAAEIYHVGPWGLGVLRSCPAVGSITAAIILAHAPMRSRVGVRMFLAVAVYGVATILFGLSTSFWLGGACLAVLGAADTISVVIRQTLIQIDTPDAMRGRVIAVYNILANTANNLGDMELGALAALAGAPATVIFGGGCAILTALAWMRLFPELRSRDRLASNG